MIGVTDAQERASQADIVPANLGNARPTANLRTREAWDYVDGMDQAMTNVRALPAYGSTLGMAVSRQFDEDIIQAFPWSATAYSRPGLTAIHEHTTTANMGLQAADLAEAIAILMDEEIASSEEDCTFVYPARQFAKLAGDIKLASMDYMQGRVTETSKFTDIYGCTPVFIGQGARRAGHGRLADNKAYVFARNAIRSRDRTIERMGVLEWVPHKRSWMVGGRPWAAQPRLQNAGIVESHHRPVEEEPAWLSM